MPDMDEILNSLDELRTHPMTHAVLIALIFLCIGIVVSKIIGRILDSIIRAKRIPKRVGILLRKTLIFIVWLIVVTQALHMMGINLVSILGAAGVAGMAIGFASQTALSNIISGVFLLTERTIKVGDYVRVNDQEGTVTEIKLLSITLRKADNSLVRVPCEMLIKTPIVNITSSPLRRCDLDLGVDYASDLMQVRRVILDVFREQQLIANDPVPAIQFSSFADSSINLHIGAWCKTEDYHAARYALANALLVAFRREGINIPFPVRTLLMQEAASPAPKPQDEAAKGVA